MQYLIFAVCLIYFNFVNVLTNSIPTSLQVNEGIHRSLFTIFPSGPVIESRNKRSYDVCPAMCALAMNRRIDISLPDIKKAVAKQAEDPFGVPTLTPDQFRTFCNDIYKPFVDCSNDCDSSDVLKTVKLTLRPVNFICMDKFDDYVENLPCLKKIKNETVSLCVNEACRENKDATKKLLEAAATIRYTQDFNNLKTLIGDNCKLLKCVMPCETEIMERRCGSTITQTYKETVKVQLDSSRELYKSAGLSWIWPNQCQFTIV